MKFQKLTTISLLFLSFLATSGTVAEESQLESMYDKAFQAFDSDKYDEALTALDTIDARQPDLAESLNLRGVVYMRQGKYDKAEKTLRKVLSIEPKFWNASFNLAEIPFLKKDWSESRNRFEALLAGEHRGLQPETNQLIQYKILLTFILQGKENMVDWTLSKFELSKDSPALYYSNAGIAFQHGNQKEAEKWMDAADKHFPAPLNRLYAESFYEVGWLQRPPGESHPTIEITSTAERAARLKADAWMDFEKAKRAFQQRDFDRALRLLDRAEAVVPGNAATKSLRGEILMEQGNFDEAEAALREALTDDSKSREAEYDLAQISFKKGDYEKARGRFNALFAATLGNEKNQAVQLIKYKIFLTLLLQGKNAGAQKLMEQFKFTGDTPALYYVHAAWEYKHGQEDRGFDWIRSARKIYSPALNVVFADSFYDLAWLKETGKREALPTSALALADASSAKEPSPALRLGQAKPLRVPVEAEQTAPAVTPAVIASKALPSASPAVSAAPTAPVVPHASAAPVVTVPASATPVAATERTAASPAVTKRNPTRARAWSQTFVDLINRIPLPRAGALLAGGLLLAGILLSVWSFVRQLRRNSATVSAYQSSTPFSAPRFLAEESPLRDQTEGAADLIETGSPKLSLNLKARESVVRAAVLPVGVSSTQGAVSVSGITEPPTASPNEGATLVAEEQDPAATEEPPLYATEEVLLPAPAETATVRETALANPTAERAEATTPGPDERDVAAEPALALHLGDEEDSLELAEEIGAPSVVPTWEPVGQGQPIPELVTALAAEPVISELTQAEPKTKLALIEPDGPTAAPIAARQATQSSIEVPSFVSKVISTGSASLLSDTPPAMPETETAPAVHHFAFSASAQGPTEAGHAAVQLTFSLEIASMQLTPALKMSRLHLKPLSRVVSVHLGSAQDPEPPMNHKATFEIAKIDLSNGTIGSVRLVPSALQSPAAAVHSSLAISSLEFVPGQGAAPVQLTPSHQEQASVQLTAEFRIGAVEFAPLFKIAAIVLNASSKKVSMQLPGAKASSINDFAGYEIENVQLGANDELALIQVARGRTH